MEQRPKLNKQLSPTDFIAFYWLKAELQTFCKEVGLKRTGSKIEVTKRIEFYLQTGTAPEEITTKKSLSNFDWNKEELTLDTVITDNYKNSENVRLFFIQHIGKTFKFNVQFMNWMKRNTGQTLATAIAAWQRIQKEKKANKKPKDIAPQFEYNTYLRDFLADNPDKDRKVGIALWKLKKAIRGGNRYERSDFDLLK